MADVYWVGQDGNIWFKDAAGTRNMGSAQAARPDASGFYDPWASADMGETPMRFTAQQISDPMVQQRAPSGGGTTRPALNQIAVDNTLGSISALDSILASQLAEDQARFAETQQLLGGQRTRQQGQFDEGVVTNNQNYGRNLMASIGAGSRGLRGLMEALGGAARGSMGDWARQAVTRQTASDIQTGADTQKENQGALESNLNTNLDAIRERERENELARTGNEAAFRRENASEKQRLLQILSGLYGDAGNTGMRDQYLQQSGALTPTIAQNSVATRGTYNAEPSNIRAAELSDFVGPSKQKMGATPNSNGEIGAGIFTLSADRDKRRLAGQAV